MNNASITMNEQTGSKGPIGWAESGLVPDALIRAGIRRLNRQRLDDIRADDIQFVSASLNEFARQMGEAEVAPVPELANEQHYELPPAFFERVLGANRKYSSCLWLESTQDLDQAEADALIATCRHAGLNNGHKVLDLGCGWGSLSLWIARNYPDCEVTSVSNSNAQRAFITQQARREGLDNIRVITCDMNDFDIEQRFDRIVSVEMFEHMRNYAELFRRINGWLNPGGRFFMHIFCHRTAAYEFVDEGANDWMSRHFFSGGIMPSADLPLRFQQDLKLENRWSWGGQHYQKTANAWLRNMDKQKRQIMLIMAETYGADMAQTWFQRWRIFFMACAELFGHDDGQEWLVGHYLFRRSGDRQS
ncbi:MAG: class I SAM-dependent methyltransferase [Xanthomonadales bacterium]|nr:class I SAM-dependent methyltransferase [Xanthomonadales bacterium]